MPLAKPAAVNAEPSRPGLDAPMPGTHAPETTAGWVKYEGNPVMGGKYGTCFDISVLKEGGAYRMWLSWRPKQSLALVESKDGIHWSEPPQIVLGPRKETGWEDDINRPVVLKREDGYHLWYTGQAKGHSVDRLRHQPRRHHLEAHERPAGPLAGASRGRRSPSCARTCCGTPDAASSACGIPAASSTSRTPSAMPPAPTACTGPSTRPTRSSPPTPSIAWEKHKVTACQVERRGDWHLMFYIGFRDEHHAQIGLARSRDGITNWQRHPANPIIRPGENQWDHDACYKPYAIFDGQKWLLWYNGRHGGSGADRRGPPRRRGSGLLKRRPLSWRLPMNHRERGSLPTRLTPSRAADEAGLQTHHIILNWPFLASLGAVAGTRLVRVLLRVSYLSCARGVWKWPKTTPFPYLAASPGYF